VGVAFKSPISDGVAGGGGGGGAVGGGPNVGMWVAASTAATPVVVALW
jgi:hypothetical protein